MAAASCRRHFIILAIICCISFTTFTWYTHTEDVQAFRDLVTHEEKSSDNEIVRNKKLPIDSVIQYDVKTGPSNIKFYNNIASGLHSDVDSITKVHDEKLQMTKNNNPSIKYYRRELENQEKYIQVTQEEPTDVEANNDFEKTLDWEVLEITELESSAPSESYPQITELESSEPTKEVAKTTVNKVTDLKSSAPTEDYAGTPPTKFIDLVSTAPTEKADKTTALKFTDLESSVPTEGNKDTAPKFTDLESSAPTEKALEVTVLKVTEQKTHALSENVSKATVLKITDLEPTEEINTVTDNQITAFGSLSSKTPAENTAYELNEPEFATANTFVLPKLAPDLKLSVPSRNNQTFIDSKFPGVQPWIKMLIKAINPKATEEYIKRLTNKIIGFKPSFLTPNKFKPTTSTLFVSTDMESILPNLDEADDSIADMTLDFESSSPQNDEVRVTEPHKSVTDRILSHPTEHNLTKMLLLKSTNIDKGLGLLIDTDGCKIPKLNPWDPSVKHLYEKQEPYECPGPPVFMKPQPGGSISLNEIVLDLYYSLKANELNCSYKSYNRKHEKPGNVRENDYDISPLKQMKFGVPLNEDYVGVFCQLENKTFEQYFPLVRLKKEIENAKKIKDKARIESSGSTATPLNVILAGIDSVSKLNFLRHFTKTQAFLKDIMSPFEMKGYTKVGDNTFPNLVPLLTGHFVEYYWNESVRNTMYFDGLDLIWKDYAREGYRTFYAEDSPYTGTFNYLKRGFYDPPTDYYYRPIGLVVENSDIRTYSKSHCFNSQLETDHIYDYLRNFIQTMDKRPFHAFAMVSTMTHDYLNNAGLADDPTVRLLTDLWDSGALNTSVLVLFSDHGLRFGRIRQTYVGKFEERMPFMFIHFPKWFLDKHPAIAKNLKTNQERLITLFDVHATMLHLLDPTQPMTEKEKSKSIRGSSLLNEITPNRTCEDANILVHWCPCQTYDAVPIDSAASLEATQAVVDNINKQLEDFPGLCAVLEIDKILDVRLGQANDQVLRFVKNQNDVLNRTVVLGEKIEPIGDYLVTLMTKPGGAVFEATVRHDPNSGTYSVLGISRINMYGKQSWCINSQKMKIFCFCKT